MYFEVKATASHRGAATTDTTRVGLIPTPINNISTIADDIKCTVTNHPSQLAFFVRGLIVLIFSHIMRLPYVVLMLD